ncbi:MAG: redoxin domain-containing protein, partial [Nakamurella sp.]
VLTAAFSIGTAIPLLLFAYAGQLAGGRLSGVRRGARRFRVAGGAVMMALAVALTFNVTEGLQRWAPAYTASIQDAVEGNGAAQLALQEVAPSAAATNTSAESPAPPVSGPVQTCRLAAENLANCGPASDLVGIDTWINTPDGAPVSMSGLKGKVVLVDFWTFACINCQHVLPSVTGWYDNYHGAGLEVIGVHTPEFAFEHDPDNVREAVIKESIHYPVGLDNTSATWRNYRNSYWPAAYLIDATGTLRYVKYGEGDYQHTETLIRQLLQAANPAVALPTPTSAPAS